MRPILPVLTIGLLFSSLGPSARAASELCIEDPTSITINHLLGDIPPVGTQLVVANCGGSTDVLNWTSSFSGDTAPFLSLSPSSGTILPGQGQDQTDPTHFGTASQTAHPTHGRQQVLLTLNPFGLTSGIISGRLTFQNVDDASNTVVVNLTLNITSINFTPGDTLVGSIDPANDVDAAAFYGLKGMTLRLTVKKSTEVSSLRLTLLDPTSAPIKSYKFKTNKTRSKKITLEEHGLFLIRIESADGSTGAYDIRTGRDLPTNATPRSFNKIKVKWPLTSVTVKFAALPGALVNANIFPKMPLGVNDIALAFQTPSGQVFDTSAFDSASQTGLHLVRVPIAEAGIFRLEISGMDKRGDRVTVPIWPFQPKGDSIVDLDQ